LKKWLLEVLDEKGVVLRKDIIHTNSKYELKRRARNFADRTPGADSYITKPAGDTDDE